MSYDAMRRLKRAYHDDKRRELHENAGRSGSDLDDRLADGFEMLTDDETLEPPDWTVISSADPPA
jgi:hypothetical protein